MVYTVLEADKSVNDSCTRGPRDLESDKPVVIGACRNRDSARAGLELYFGKHVLRRRAAIPGSGGKKRDACVTGCDVYAFRRQVGVRSAGANRDPVACVTWLGRELERSKGCGGL